MNPKQLVGLIVICAALGVIGLVVARSDKATSTEQTERAGRKVLPDLDVNAVSAITITDGEGTTTISRGDEHWVVEEAAGYRANFDVVRNLLRTLMDVKTAQIVRVGKANYGRLQLNAPGEEDGATKLTLLGENGAEVAALLLGKEHVRKGPANSPFGGNYPDGRYLTVPDSGTVALVSETFSEVAVDPKSWIDKTFVKVDKIRSGEARNQDGAIWTVARESESADLKLAGEVPETHEVDSSKLTGIDSTLRFPSFSEIGGRADAKDWGFDGNGARAFLAKTFDGRTWTVKIGKQTEDKQYPVQIKVAYQPPPLPPGPEDESDEDKAKRQKAHDDKIAETRKEVEEAQALYDGWVYLVASHTVDDLLYSRDDLLKEKEKKEGDKAAADQSQLPIPFIKNPTE